MFDEQQLFAESEGSVLGGHLLLFDLLRPLVNLLLKLLAPVGMIWSPSTRTK